MNKLQKVATRALKVLGTFNLSMDSYAGNGLYSKENMDELNETNVCNTTFCLAGYLAYDDKHPYDFYEKTCDGFEFDHYAYSCDLLGGNAGLIWEFFFSSYWSNNVSAAEDRMQFVIEHGRIPTNFESDFDSHKEWI